MSENETRPPGPTNETVDSVLESLKTVTTLLECLESRAAELGPGSVGAVAALMVARGAVVNAGVVVSAAVRVAERRAKEE